jgi:hypothetical protein
MWRKIMKRSIKRKLRLLKLKRNHRNLIKREKCLKRELGPTARTRNKDAEWVCLKSKRGCLTEKKRPKKSSNSWMG